MIIQQCQILAAQLGKISVFFSLVFLLILFIFWPFLSSFLAYSFKANLIAVPVYILRPWRGGIAEPTIRQKRHCAFSLTYCLGFFRLAVHLASAKQFSYKAAAVIRTVGVGTSPWATYLLENVQYERSSAVTPAPRRYFIVHCSLRLGLFSPIELLKRKRCSIRWWETARCWDGQFTAVDSTAVGHSRGDCLRWFLQCCMHQLTGTFLPSRSIPFNQ